MRPALSLFLLLAVVSSLMVNQRDLQRDLQRRQKATLKEFQAFQSNPIYPPGHFANTHNFDGHSDWSFLPVHLRYFVAGLQFSASGLPYNSFAVAPRDCAPGGHSALSVAGAGRNVGASEGVSLGKGGGGDWQGAGSRDDDGGGGGGGGGDLSEGESQVGGGGD